MYKFTLIKVEINIKDIFRLLRYSAASFLIGVL